MGFLLLLNSLLCCLHWLLHTGIPITISHYTKAYYSLVQSILFCMKYFQKVLKIKHWSLINNTSKSLMELTHKSSALFYIYTVKMFYRIFFWLTFVVKLCSANCICNLFFPLFHFMLLKLARLRCKMFFFKLHNTQKNVKL